MLYNVDCEQFLANCQSYDCIFMDPPDNIGLEYSGFDDSRVDYYQWLTRIIQMAVAKSNVCWISYNAIHDVAIKRIRLRMQRDWKTFIWRYTFGQYRSTDCGSGYRPILRISRKDWKPDVSGIKVLSVRSKMGDKRAAGLRVPDDVWEFPRVTGNNKERRAWHPTQHPEALMERIMRMSPGSFLDCFAGTGTSLRVGKELNRSVDACELSTEYYRRIFNEIS